MVVGGRVHQYRLGEGDERAGGRCAQDERDEEEWEPGRERVSYEHYGREDAAPNDKGASVAAVGQQTEGRFDERGDHGRGREQDADLSVAEIEVVTDQRESRGKRAEDELVPEFDREENRARAAVEGGQLRRVWHPASRMRLFGARDKQPRYPS